MFIVIMALIVFGHIVWWRWAYRSVRVFPKALPWQIVVTIFALAQLGYLLFFVLAPVYARRIHPWLPMPIVAFMYIWDLMILPPTLIMIAIVGLVGRIGRRARGEGEAPAEPVLKEAARQEPRPPGRESTRRQFLAAGAMTLPPLLAAGGATRAIWQLGHLRLRSIDVAIPDLPAPLDGFTIAHVTDTHIGRFTRRGALDNVVEMTNRLRADLVVFTGDLIDLSLSDFPHGVDLIHRLDPKLGLVMIEGNHDLIEDPEEFESRAKQAGLPILLDETRTMNLRGVPVQFLGIRWGKPIPGERRHTNNQITRESVEQILTKRDPNAFPILLAHHPHAFDPAIEAGIPLTLSGHTHGGQLMLTERLGAGSVMFRYWSGLYTRGNSSLVVSNGAGNWFPLRINAPAEIVHLTLRAL